MSSQFEVVGFQVRKYLLDMKVGEQRTLSARTCKYTSLKSTATQLKKAGYGIWSVHHSKNDHSVTLITRVA